MGLFEDILAPITSLWGTPETGAADDTTVLRRAAPHVDLLPDAIDLGDVDSPEFQEAADEQESRWLLDAWRAGFPVLDGTRSTASADSSGEARAAHDSHATAGPAPSRTGQITY